MLSNEEFINKFNTKLLDIDEDNLAYVNEVINLNGKRLDKNDEHKDASISIDTLLQIQLLAFSLQILKNKGITAENYPHKLKSFIKFKTKALEEFGIVIKDKRPYANPAHLHFHIDALLSKEGLTVEQKNNFYSLFGIRNRVPEQKFTDKLLQRERIRNTISEIHDKVNLSENDHIAIDNKDKNHIFPDSLYEVLKKYGFNEVPFEIFTHESYAKHVNKQLYNKDMTDYNYLEDDPIEEIIKNELLEFEFSFVKGYGQNLHDIRLSKYMRKETLQEIIKTYCIEDDTTIDYLNGLFEDNNPKLKLKLED